MDEENHVSLKVTCANRNFSDSPALRGKIHNLLRVLTLFYILSRGKTAATCHGAAGNQGVSCPQRLRSRSLPRNQRECGRIQCTTCKAVFTVLPHFVLRYRTMRPDMARDALIATHGGLSLEWCAVICHPSPMA